MKKVNANSVLGVMNLFNSEEYYKYANDVTNPSYNIYKVSNDLIEALTGHNLLCA